MSEINTSRKVAAEDLLQDVFGLNIRGLRSLIALWASPRTYMEAAQTTDWKNAYTPSIRLWFSLLALSSLLKFIWIGADSPLVSEFADGFRSYGVVLTDGQTYESLGQSVLYWIYGIFPVLQTLSFFLLAMIYRAWARPTSLALRERLLFAVMTPSASLLIFVTLLLAYVPVGWFQIAGALIAILALSIDVSTAYRGVFHKQKLKARILRSFALALAIVAVNVVCNIASQILGIVLFSYWQGLTVAG